MTSQADHARRADSPWRTTPINGTRGASNTIPAVKPGDGAKAKRARTAFRAMSESELTTGRSDEWWREFHETNRARVRARWAKDAA